MLKPGVGGEGPVQLKLEYDSHAKALAFLAAMRSAGPQAVIKGINFITTRWQREIVRHMPVDKGTARQSIQVSPAEQDANGRITGAVGSNVEHVTYLEYGGKNQRGLMAALRIWRPGMDPILHWYAKDMGIADLEDKRDRAKTDKSRIRHQAAIDKANSSSTEEFAPPFRGSWQMIEEELVTGLRTRLAKLIREGKVDGT
jgi:hypothetical protein